MSRLYLVIAVAAFFAVALVTLLVAIKRLLIVVMPNELVILIGRRYRAPSGHPTGQSSMLVAEVAGTPRGSTPRGTPRSSGSQLPGRRLD